MSSRIHVPVDLVFDYESRPAVEPRPERVALLLHGYEQNGRYMINKLGPAFDESTYVIAPNGPFPLPKRTDEGYRVGFSWYFYDPKTDDYYIDMSVSIQAIKSLLGKLQLEELPIVIVGFSQGGYLAPFVAKALKARDRHVVGIACEFLYDEVVPYPKEIRMDAIHGEKDTITDPVQAQIAHKKFVEMGSKGEFTLIPNLEHRITDQVRDKVNQLIEVR